MSEDKRPRVRQDVLNAKPVKASKDNHAAAKPPAFLKDRFDVNARGIFWKKSDSGGAVWICSYLKVVADVRDSEQGNWGVLAEWPDLDGHPHKEILPRSAWAGSGAELRALLSAGGLLLNPRSDAQQGLLEFFASSVTSERAIVVSRNGWADIGGLPTFVLPDNTLGATRERVIFHAASREPSPFNQAGDLAGWRSNVAEAAIGNNRLLLAISLAFVGPLLRPLNEEGGGIHLRGPAKSGKTLALVMAASVWGGKAGSGAKSYVANWRGTANAIEAMALAHNDTFACLDEAGQIDGKEMSEVIYMIPNGRGKLRADRMGAAKAVSAWLLAFLSSGEISIEAKLAEAGKPLRAGQEVRCIDLSADAGCGHGIFDSLGEEARTAEELAQTIYTATRTHYGTAGLAYLTFLVDTLRRDPRFPERLAADVEKTCSGWLSEKTGVSAQVRTVARRFALVAAAGELASRAQVTGWGSGIAAGGVKACFDAWLTDRGDSGSREDVQAIKQLQDFVDKHGSSRFVDWIEKLQDDALQPGAEAGPPIERYRVQNRAGWRRWDVATKTYTIFITREAMHNDILAGLDYKSALKVLAAGGYLVPDKTGRVSISLRPPGCEKMRLYQYSRPFDDDDRDST